MTLLRIFWLKFVLFLAAIFPVSSHATNFEHSVAQRVRACTTCHGEQGRAGPDGYYPRLAGKPAAYLYNQLLNFREGRRHYSLMTGLVDGLHDGYLMEIAQYFSALDLPHPKPLKSTASAQVLARGEVLATKGDAALGLPACTQCHGATLMGALPQFPGLLGLPRDYLNAQLGGWKTGQRKAHAPDCMAQIAKTITDADANAVTHWLATQPIPQGARPEMAATTTPHLNPATACGTAKKTMASKLPGASELPNTSASSRGEYLARIGNCAACHTARGGMAFAGGKRLETPFGAAFSTNITPHPEQGLGAWSKDDFWRAMHHGQSRDGRLLNPVFPYTNYTQVTRDDSDALFDYLRTLAPSDRANTKQALRWPFSTQWALAVWRWLYFKPANPSVGTSLISRGNYLVQGLGHCSACHAPRNLLGAVSDPAALRGAIVPGTAWFAPSLLPDLRKPWSQSDLVRYLTTGYSGHGNAHGPMAEVVSGGTQYLTAEDALAVARVLQPRVDISQVASLGPAQAMLPSPTPGSKLYEKHCADCHGPGGRGIEGAYPRLVGSATVNAQPPYNLLQITLLGGFGPTTAQHTRPFGMPPFQLQLSNLELSLLLTHLRTSWGNTAPPVSEFDISKLRRSAAP